MAVVIARRPELEARSIGADVIVDTRVDPLMPHNAIFVRSAVERLHFSDGETQRSDPKSTRTATSACIVEPSWRFEPCARTSAVPRLPFTNRCSVVRAISAAFARGMPLATRSSQASVELRIPTTSPLRMARFGYSVFMDAGTTYDRGQRFGDQKLEKGVGAGIWATAPLFRFSVAVARGIGSGMRVHVGAGLTL